MGTMFAALRGRGAPRPAPRGFVLIKGHKRPTMFIPASRPAGSWLHATPAVRAALVLSCDASEALLGCGDEVAGGYQRARGNGDVEREARLVIRTNNRREALGIDAPREIDCAFPRGEKMAEIHRTRFSEVIPGGRHVAQNLRVLIVE